MLQRQLRAAETGDLKVKPETVNSVDLLNSSIIKIRFRVKNVGVMPHDVQMQIFQRSFSTKGRGRGIGTYSIRLLTENYLKGKVSFTSNEVEGTVFSVELSKNFRADSAN
jgi:sensor histidine kinase regulating citrate/malate metabolism